MAIIYLTHRATLQDLQSSASQVVGRQFLAVNAFHASLLTRFPYPRRCSMREGLAAREMGSELFFESLLKKQAAGWKARPTFLFMVV
jgi:hypothetical protein